MKILSLSALAALAFLAACTLPLTPRAVSVQLVVGQGARYLSPDRDRLELVGVGPDGAVLEPVPLAEGENNVSGFVLGTWTLEVREYDAADSLIGRGMAVTELDWGTNDVIITLGSPTQLEIKGANLLYPEGGEVIVAGNVYGSTDLTTPLTSPDCVLTDGLLRPYQIPGYVIQVEAATGTDLSYAWVLDGELLTGQTGSICSLTMGSGFSAGEHHLVCLLADGSGLVYSQEIVILSMEQPQ
ncbi:MAG: hypothetical protein WCG80_15555 [Spirochaetales bacterium]